MSTRATVADQGVHAALLPVGGDEIELLEPTNPTGGVARFLEKKGEGIHHLCVETSDVAAALARAKAAGLPTIDQAPRKGLAGTIGFLHPGACHGVLVELAQPASFDHPHVPASDGVRATGIESFYLSTKDLGAAAETFSRNFDAAIQGPERDSRFLADRIVARIGDSRVTLLDANQLAASAEVSNFLGGRTEGLLGLCLAVADFDGALRHLGEKGISVEVRENAKDTPLAKVAPGKTHGVGLFLSPRR